MHGPLNVKQNQLQLAKFLVADHTCLFSGLYLSAEWLGFTGY